MMRWIAHLIIPASLRRPLADRVYDFISKCKNIGFSGISETTDLASSYRNHRISRYCSITRLIIAKCSPLYFLKGIVFRFKGLKDSAYHRTWTAIGKYRHVLGAETVNLDFSGRLLKLVLLCTIRLYEYPYYFYFSRLQQRLAPLRIDVDDRNNKRIVLMIGTLGPGGAERQLVLTATGIVNKGVDLLRVICVSLQSESNQFLKPDLERAGIHVTDLNEVKRNHKPDEMPLDDNLFADLPESLKEVASYALALAEAKPEVAHLWLDEVNIKAGIAAILLGVPRIVLGMRSQPPYNFKFHQPYMREAYRWLASYPNVTLLNNSQAGASAYEEWLRLPSGRIDVVHNGFEVDPVLLGHCRLAASELKVKNNISSGSPVIGTVIRISEEKRPFLWLEIAAMVRKQLPKARFLVVGDGPLRAEMERRADNDDLRGAVIFLGHQKNVMTALAAMDLFLLTSRSEGLPNVLIEAQIANVPVVTTNVGGAAETLEHNITGWVLENDDSSEAADIVVKLLADKLWQKRARAAMPSFVEKLFNSRTMVARTLELYRISLN